MSAPVLPNEQIFQANFQALLDQLPEGIVSSHAFVTLPSNQKPWLDSGLDLAAGESVTSFVTGRTYLKGTQLWFGADFQVWFRIGENGEIFRGTRASHSFTATNAGRLYLASYFPGEWANRTGGLATPPEVYELVSGSQTALIVRWSADTTGGLRQLAGLGDVDGLIAGEIARQNHPNIPPAGWNYLWFVGPAEIYRSSPASHRKSAITCHTHRDVGLLQKDILLPLTPETQLRWAWRMDKLPSQVREDNLATHDYLSIAVEFDNSQDITYYWSAELPVGTAYRCPIPTWTARETHVVIRSGAQGQGQWHNEERNVFRDYAEYIGGEMPSHIVRVWLIAVSFFQGQEGNGEYADIAFLVNDQLIEVQ